VPKVKEKELQLTNNLTYRERMFVRIFDGDVYEAGRKCGFTDKQAEKLMLRKRIKDGISRKDTIVDPLSDDHDILRRKSERMMFWMQTMYDGDIEMKDRLRATELSGKADGDFVERVQVEEHKEIVIRWGIEGVTDGAGSCNPVHAESCSEDDTRQLNQA
jgi:hypothetical protein